MNLNYILKHSNALLEAQKQSHNQHVKITENKTEIYGSDKSKLYIPTPTGDLFHSDNSFVRLIIGPYGSGKTSACCNEIVRRACAMPYWYKGRRKSKWAIVRNTSGELQSTTLQTWLQWFGDLGDIAKRQKPILTYEHCFNDGNGFVELELIFLALDRPDDVRKVKSLELCGVYLNELSELPQNVLSHFKGRVNGRYPSKSFCSSPYWSGIIADTNPPEVDHWIYKDFETKNLDSYKIFHQPPGLLKDDNTWLANPNADNAANLSPDYYLKLAEGQTEDFIKVFCLGEYGSVGFGRKVYSEFNSDLHIQDNIEAIQGHPLLLGWDFGLNPSCIVTQLTPRGSLLVLKEYTSEDMGIRTFAQSIVIPGIMRDFPYCKVGESYADPSGVARDSIMEELSCISELTSLGIDTLPASTNDLDVRISSVRYFLNTMIDGKPAFYVSRRTCPVLVKGFIKDYVYKRLAVSGEERYKDKPDKNFSSHIHDALQYACLSVAATSISQKKEVKHLENFFNPPFRYL